MLALDLGVFSRKNQVVTFKEATIWSLAWITLALCFFAILDYAGEMLHGIETVEQMHAVIAKYKLNIHIPANADAETSMELFRRNMALEFLTGYLIEYALSVDNIFVMILIFTSFQVRERYYKKVLFLGILGAIVMRFAFIFIGSALLQRFEWILYLFGAFLIITGIKMFFDKDEDDSMDPSTHPVVRFTSKYFRVFPRYVKGYFFVRKGGKLLVTPLFVVLMIIEFTDLIFAVDSVPAVFAVTKDPFLVFFSNIFAILGLRSMFFFLANIMHLFHYLKTGLAVLLSFIGIKMIAHHYVHINNLYSLYIIVGILAVSVIASLLFPEKKEVEAE